MPRPGSRPGCGLLLFVAVSLGCLGGLPASSSQHCEERPQDTTALLLQRGGPEVIIVEYNVTTGRPTGLRKVIKRQWSALSGFAVDSQAQRAYFFTPVPRVALYSFTLAVSGISELMSTHGDGLRLRDSSNSSVPNVWNVAPWESRGSLLAVAPSAKGVFNTSVMAVNTSSGLVSVLGEVRGSPIQGINAIDSKGGRYFFLVTQAHRGRALVVYHVEGGQYELVGFDRDVADLAGMHYDRDGCQLVVILVRPKSVLEVLTVELPEGGQGDAKLMHLGTTAWASGQTYEPYQYMGLTALLRVGSKLSMLSREPNLANLAIHHLEQKSKIAVDIDSYDIVGMAIRTRRRPTVTDIQPGEVGIWGESHGEVIGFDFGIRDPSPVVYVGNTKASSVLWISDSSVGFRAPVFPTRISDPWLRADGYVYRTSWGSLQGAVDLFERKEVNVCHPSFEVGKVCAYAGTRKEMRCTELSVGFVCARWDSGWDETVSLDVQLGVDGSWLSSNIGADVVPTWFLVQPTAATVDGGQVLTISGGPFTKDKGDVSCRFGGQIDGTASYLNSSMVTCDLPRWPLLPGKTKVELLQGGLVMPSDFRASFLFVTGVPAQMVLLAGPAEVVADVENAIFEIQVRDQDGNPTIEHVLNITAHIVPVALVQKGVFSNAIHGVMRRETVDARASFVFSIERAGTYQIQFATASCGNGAHMGSNGCVTVNTTLEVLLGVPIKTITVSAPRHALAGLSVFPEPQIRVLDSENRVSDVAVQVVAKLAGSYDNTTFSASNVSTSGGVVYFTDLTILPNGTHTIIFTLTGTHSAIEVRHNISILYSQPTQLFNAGSRPLGTYPSMLPISPPPSVWVLDVAGNRILTRYWTQDGNGTLIPHDLNVFIHAELSSDNRSIPSAAIYPAGSLFGAVEVLLQGQPAAHGQGRRKQLNASAQLNYSLGVIDYIQLRIHDPVYVESINVYETYRPGRLVKIQLLDPSGMWDTVWQGVPANQASISTARIFSPQLSPLCRRSYLTQNIRLEVDNIDSTDRYEVDKVEVIGSNRLSQPSAVGAAAGQCLQAGCNYTGYGVCNLTGQWLASACSCEAGWQGAQCSVPSQSHLCGGGDACESVLGYWDAFSQTCVCLDSCDLQYSVTQNGGASADFTELLIDTQGKGYVITFTAEGLLPATSLLFAIAPGVPSRLYVTSHPMWGAAGAGFPNSSMVALKDAGQNVVPGPYVGGALNVTVSLVDAPASATLTGMLIRKIYQGSAIFTDLIINLPSSPRLKFSGPDVIPAYTDAFDIQEGPLHVLHIVRQPDAASGGTPFSLQPKMEVLDPAGNTVSRAQGRVVASLQGLEMLLGDIEIPLVNGVAEFTDLAINRNASGYQILFKSYLQDVEMPGIIGHHRWYAAANLSALSHSFQVMNGRVVNVVIFRQPGHAYGGEIVPQPILHFVDKGGNKVSRDRIVVHVAVRQAQGTDVILPRYYATDTGSIEFTDLELLVPGTRFRLVFTVNETASERWAGRNPSVVSSFFDNTFGALSNLSISVQPGNVAAGWYFRPIQVVLMDRSGNPVPKTGVQISVVIDVSAAAVTYSTFNSSLSPDGSPTLVCRGDQLAVVEGTSPVLTTQGVAVFTDLRVGRAGTGFRLVFESTLLKSAESQSFGVTLGEIAVSLHVVCNPGIEVAGVSFAQQPVLDVVDRGGNRMHAQIPQRIEAKLIPRTWGQAGMTGVLSASMFGDLAKYTNLAIDLANTGYVIEFYSEGLNSARTFQFDVIPGPAVALHVEPISQPFPSERFPVRITSRDRGGNINSSTSNQSFGISAQLMGVESLTRTVSCRGAKECVAALDLSVPTGSRLLSANISISVSCTDFDSQLEHIASIMTNQYSLKQTSDFKPGPFAGCFRDCSKSAQITASYDIVHKVCLDGGLRDHPVCQSVPMLYELDVKESNKWNLIQSLNDFNTTSVPLKVQVSSEVNFNPCNGYILDASVQVVLTYTVPADADDAAESILMGNHRAVSQDGLAVFTDLMINVIQRDFVLSFTADSNQLLPAYSSPFRLSHGSVSQLVILTQPKFGTGNATLMPAPLLMLADAADNLVDTSGELVRAQLLVRSGVRPLAAQLRGQTTVASKQGLVQFTDLFVGIKSEGFNYTILFSLVRNDTVPACNDVAPACNASLSTVPACNASLSICSAPFTVFEGPACCMRIMVRPTKSTGGVPFSPQPALKSYDWGGNEIALSNANVSAKIGINGAITGQVLGDTAFFANGSAQFTELAIDKAGSNYSVVFTSPKMISVTSLPFSILVGTAIRLEVNRQIAGARVGKLFDVQPSVAVLDAGGNVVKSWNGTVLVDVFQQGTAIHSSIPTEGNATLTGDQQGFMYQGVSFFWNLRLNRTGTNFRLRFSATGLTCALSAPFDVFGGPATRLVVVSSPSVYTNMLPTPEIAIAAFDDAGNVDGYSMRSFHLMLLQPIGGSLQLMEPPELIFSKGVLTIRGMKLAGMGVQARWRISETTPSSISVESEPFDMIDPLTGWWSLNMRMSAKKLFLHRDLNTFQVRASVDDLHNAVQGIRQPMIFSKYPSLLKGNDLCMEASLADYSSSTTNSMLGYHLRSCEAGVIVGYVASKVSTSDHVDATWARDIIYLEIQEYAPVHQMQKFIVIANSKNSSSTTADTVVYRWSAQGLTLYQRLADTKGAHDIEHFVYGGMHYIIVANHFDEGGTGYGVPSTVYQYTWSRSENRNIFKPIQAISTEGSVAWKFFEIDHQQFLVAANYFNGSHHEINSTIYRLERINPDTLVPRISLFQWIPTNGARDVVYISDKTNHLIAFANRYENSVQVMQWSHSFQRFLPAPNLPCAQAVDLEVFTADGVSYVVCISLTNIQLSSNTIPVNGSAVFRYNGSDAFIRVQQLPTQTGKYLSMFTSGDEILLSIANVELIHGSSVPPYLQDRHTGSTDIFLWNGTYFLPYLTIPTVQGYANAILEVLCSGLSQDGSPCGSRELERLVLVAQGEASGIQTIVLDSIKATRVATHLKVLPVTLQAASTMVNSTVAPAFSSRVMNIDEPSSLSWIQETITADSLKWSDPILGTLDLGASFKASGTTQVLVNASGYAVFPDVAVIAAGPVSMRMSNMYLNEVCMATTPKFTVTAGSPKQLIVYSTAALALFSGDSLSAIVLVCDAFGNHQPLLSLPVTIRAFSNGTSGLNLFNDTVTTRDGIARFVLSVSGDSKTAVVGFRAPPLTSAFTPTFSVTTRSVTVNIGSNDVLISSASALVGENQLLVFGGRNGTVASNAVRIVDMSELPYTYSVPSVNISLPSARYDHAVVGNVYLNFNPAVLFIGGTNGTTAFNDVHKYDSVTRQWKHLNLALGTGRSLHRAQKAKVTYNSSGTSHTFNVIAVVGGKDSSGSAVNEIEILRLLSTSVRVETVAADIGSPFAAGVFDCCSFMFKWHDDRGYVFGMNSSGDGSLYKLQIQFDPLKNLFQVQWTRQQPGDNGVAALPRSALSSSAFELGGKLYFLATQSTAENRAAVYGLDVSGALPMWLEAAGSLGAFYLPNDSIYSIVGVSTGKALLIPTIETSLGPSPSRRLLSVANSVLLLSVVTSERLTVATELSGQAFSGLMLSPQPVVYIAGAQGKRARDQSGHAFVKVTAYDGDTLAPIGLKGLQVIESEDGIAKFIDLAVIQSADRVMLKFSSPSIFAATFGPIKVSTGPGAYAVFQVQPYGAQRGKLFSIQPTVKLTDAAGNDVTTDSTTIVSLTLRQHPGVDDASQYLTGTSTESVSLGAFTFADLGMTQNTPTNTDFRLIVLAAGITSGKSNPFHVVRPSETRLHLNMTTEPLPFCTSQPPSQSDCSAYSAQTLMAGFPSIRSPRLRITLDSAPTLYDPSAYFNVTLVRADNHSVVVGDGLPDVPLTAGGELYFGGMSSITVAGQGYQLKFESPGFPVLFSDAFDVQPGAPHSMYVMRNPLPGNPAGLSFALQPIVFVIDAFGNAVGIDTRVSADLTAANPGNSSGLTGNTIAIAREGIAIFTNLAVARAGSGYSLNFSVSDLCCGSQLAATSAPFAINTSAPYKLAERTTPSGGKGAEPFVSQPSVLILDAGDNVVVNDSSTIVTAKLDKDRSLVAYKLTDISTPGKTVAGMEHFRVNGTDYMFMAVKYDEAIDSYHVESVLYRWNGVAEVMEEVQRIMTDGATSAKHVQYNDQHYLFVTNGYNELEVIGNEMVGTYLTDSDIYHFVEGRLEKLESFGTQGPTHISFFTANNLMYVVVANSFDGTTTEVKSDVYRFSPTTPGNASKLTLVQELSLGDVSNLHSFSTRGQLYVVVASRYNATSAEYACNSEILHFRDGLLETSQAIRTYGIVVVESFTVAGDLNFVALGNSVNKEGSTVDKGFVAIHEFRDGLMQETAAQELGPISAISAMQHFLLNGTEFLTVISNPEVGDGALLVYRWDASSCSNVRICTPNFTLTDSLPISTAESVEYFRGEGTETAYLVYGGAAVLQGIAFRSASYLVGTKKATAQNGIATFTDLGVNLAQAKYRLSYEAVGLESAKGEDFDVEAGIPVRLSLLTEAGDALGGEVFRRQARVGLVDRGGNLVLPEVGQVVNVSLLQWQSQTAIPQLRGNVQALVQNGIATFTDVALDRVGWSVLRFACSSYNYTLQPATQMVTVQTGEPYGLEVLQVAGLSLGGLPFGQQPKLSLVDAGGNFVTDDAARSSGAVRVAVSISSGAGTSLSAVALGDRVTAALVASPSGDVEFITVEGETLLVMAVSEGECAVYSWGCNGPRLVQTFAAEHVADFDVLRAEKQVLLFVASTLRGVLRILVRGEAMEEFVLKHAIRMQGLASVKGMLIGGKPFVLANGNGSGFVSNYSSLYSLSVNNKSTVTAFENVQNMSMGQVIDAEHFRFKYKDYLVIQTPNHLILNVWNSNAGIFEVLDKVDFTGEDVVVTCCAASGLPFVAVASVNSLSIVATLEAAQLGEIGLQKFRDVLNNGFNNGVPGQVSADTVRHLWRGNRLFICFSSESSVSVHMGESSWIGEQPMEAWSLPPTYNTNATRMQQAVMFFEVDGAAYILLTGRDDDTVVLLLDGPGTLSGTTVVQAVQGIAEFTDLTLDLIGAYDLSFSAISLDIQHESYDAQVAAGAVMNVSVVLGQPSSLALTYVAEGFYPSVLVVDRGGNQLAAAADDLSISVKTTRDISNVYSTLKLLSSYSQSYPAHVHHLAVNGSHFVAIANSFDGSTYSTLSKIMKMETSADGLVVLQGVQSIQTKCAYRFSSFNMTSHNVTRTSGDVTRVEIHTDYYLAVANHFDDSDPADPTYSTKSVIYKRNPTTEIFDVFQEIPTLGATQLAPFVINGRQYLAIANFFDGSFHSVNSEVWKWDTSAGNFSWEQNIATVGAHDIEYLSAGGKHFLLVAQYRSSDEVGFGSSSLVLQHSETLGTFERLTEFASAAARDIEAFSIQGVGFFAVANAASLEDGTDATKSVIYRLECADGDSHEGSFSVSPHQAVDTNGASSWTHFERGGVHYMAITALDGDEDHIITALLVWNGTYFNNYTNVSTDGQMVIAGDFFTFDGLYYGVMAMPNDNTVNLYRFESAAGVPPETWGPEAVSGGQVNFTDNSAYSVGDAFDFYTDPRSKHQLQPAASGQVT